MPTLSDVKSRLLIVQRDVVACLPILCFGAVSLLIWAVYQDVGRWPIDSSSDPKGAGFEFTGLWTVILVFVPLLVASLGIVSSVAIGLATLSDFADSKRVTRVKIILRGVVQFAVSIVGVVLFFPMLGRIIVWVID